MIDEIKRICGTSGQLKSIRLFRNTDVMLFPPVITITTERAIEMNPGAQVIKVDYPPSRAAAVFTERRLGPGVSEVSLTFRAGRYSLQNSILLQRYWQHKIHALIEDKSGNTLLLQYTRLSWKFTYNGKNRVGFDITLQGTTRQAAYFTGDINEYIPVTGGLITLAGAQLIDLEGAPLVALST